MPNTGVPHMLTKLPFASFIVFVLATFICTSCSSCSNWSFRNMVCFNWSNADDVMIDARAHACTHAVQSDACSYLTQFISYCIKLHRLLARLCYMIITHS